MNMLDRKHTLRAISLILLIGMVTPSARSDDWGRPRRVVGAAPVVVSPQPMLGTFYPDRMLFMGGDLHPQMGYSPFGMYGDNSLSLTGPLSNFRMAAAPVVTYSRGYDGSVHPDLGTSISYPIMPSLSPVVYPTRANVSPGFRVLRTPPQWQSAIHWIDQN